MSLEVGRISARIEGDLADFDKKMAGASRTFENTAAKMQAASKSATATIQKTYADRIVAANQSAQKEVDAIARAMRERLRMTQTSGEVAAVRKIYDERVAAVRAGLAREVQAIQQAHLAATRGLRPAVVNLDEVVAATNRARPSLNSVRAAMTSLAASSLQLAPGVGQVTSVLGGMALGTPWMIGILGGAAAIVFAWDKITAAARKLKEEAKAASDEVRKMRLGTAGALSDKMAAIGLQVEADKAKLAGPGAVFMSRGALRETKERIDQGLKDVAFLNKEILRIHAETREKDAKEESSALKKRLDAEKEAFEKQAEEIVRRWQRMQIRWDPFGTGSSVRLGTAGQVGTVGNVPTPQRFAFGQAAAVAARGLGGGLSGGGPGIGAALPIDTSATGGLGLVNKSLNALGASMLGPIALFKLLDGVMKPLTPVIEALSVPIVMFGEVLGKAIVPILQAFWPVIKRTTIAASYLAEVFFTVTGYLQLGIGKFVEAVAKLLNKIIPFGDPFNFLVKQGQEMQKTGQGFIDAGKDMKKLREDLRDLEFDDALKGLTDSANKAAEALTNVPTGFKIALARFNATTGLTDPRLPTSDPSRLRGGGIVTFTGDIHVHGVEDPKTFLEKVEQEVTRKIARGGSSLILDYV